MGTSGQFVMGSIRLLAAAALLALFGMLFFAPPLVASSDDSNIVCPPHIPPFPPLPCFDLDIRDSGTPIDDESKDKLDETNENLREQRGGNWGLPSIVPADPGTVVSPSLDAPANLSVTPGEGYLDISWDAVSGATGYDVEAQTAGSSSWHDVASVTGTSHRYTTSATIDHVRVRASDGSGVSDWSQVSRLPAADWLDTVQSSGGASASSAGGSIASQLSAPTGLTVTRENSPRDEKLSVSWTAVTNAQGYNLACSASPGGNVAFTAWKWWHCGSVDSGSTTTFTVDDDKRGGVTRDLSYGRSYAVAIRAVTGTPSDASPWTASEDAHPARMPTGNISVSRADGSLTISWIQPPLSTGYEIYCATIENGVLGADQLCADVETATVGSDRRVTATITSWTVGGTTYTVDDSKTYSLVVSTTNAWGKSPGKVAPTIYPPPRLTASNVGDDSATLTIANHTGNWYVKKTTPTPAGTCSTAIATTTHNLSNLTGGTTYTYSAYSDGTCSTLLATTTFITQVAVDNLDKGPVFQWPCGISGNSDCAVAFTTGSNASGYTLTAITARFADKSDSSGNLGNLVATLRSDDSGRPNEREILASLTVGSNPDTAGDYRVTCDVAECALSPNTTYFVMLSADAGSTANYETYNWQSTENNDEDLNPAGNGWTLANGTDHRSGEIWQTEYSDTGKMKITAKINSSLTASSVTATGATLTIANHAGAWWYKSATTGKTDCTSAGSTASASVTGLTPGTAYVFKAYSDSSCGTLLATASEFTTLTPSLTASNVAATTATLTIANHTGNWYYKSTTAGKTACTGPVSGTSVTLTGLNGNTSYTYSAYSDSSCGTLLAAASSFKTLLPPTLTASAVTGTTATLTIDNHTAAWWYDANTGPDTTCQSVSADTSSDSLTGLTAGTVYVYTAYGKSGCNAADLLVTTTFGTPQSVSASNLGESAHGTYTVGPNSAHAQEFTTGNATGGYTLSSVTLDFQNTSNAGAVTVAIHGVQSNGKPETAARATLTGTAGNGQRTFTCTTGSNNNCALAADTSYFVLVDASAANAIHLNNTNSDVQTLTPSGNGWSIADDARNEAWGWTTHNLALKMSVSATGGAASASLTATSTSLTIADYTGSWYYQANAAPHASCQGPVTGTSQAISGLTGGTSYTYKAYADSGCAVLLATASAFTAPATSVSVSTLDGALFSSYQVGNYLDAEQAGAQAFTTGSNTGGYTLSSIDIRFGTKYGSPTDLVVTLHAASGSNPNTGTTLATLSGSTSPSTGSHTYTCSGSGCDLSASTTYFVLLAAPNSTGTSTYTVDLTSAAETKQPSNNGWSIADKGRENLSGTWVDMTAAVKMKVTATAN